MSGVDCFLFGNFVSLSIQRFEYICQYSGGKSFEEQIGGFGISLCVSSLSSIFFKVGYVLGDMWPLHAALIKCHSGSLLFIEVLKLGFELVKELSPYDREVLIDVVKSVDPGAHVFDPPGNFISFDKGEGKCDFFDRRIKPGNVLVNVEVRFNFFDEIVCFGAIACKDCWFLTYGSNICCNWDRSLALASWLRLGRRSCTTSTTTTTTTSSSTSWSSSSSASTSSSGVVLVTEGVIELVDDFW